MTDLRKDITSYKLSRQQPYGQLRKYVSIHCLTKHFSNDLIWEAIAIRRTVEGFIKEVANAQ